MKVVRAGFSLSHLDAMDSAVHTVSKQAMPFMASFYGQDANKSMSEVPWKVWASDMGASALVPLQLYSLPPTNEAFAKNVKRAHHHHHHHQAIVWRSLDVIDPPELEPEQYGWKKAMMTRALESAVCQLM